MFNDTRINNFLDEHYAGNDIFLIDGTEYDEETAREYAEEMYGEMDAINSAWCARW